MKKIDEFTGGYLVEYSEKEEHTKPYGDRKNMICTQEELVKLLQNKYRYAVWSCKYIWVKMYLDNHQNEEIELRGLEKSG